MDPIGLDNFREFISDSVTVEFMEERTKSERDTDIHTNTFPHALKQKERECVCVREKCFLDISNHTLCYELHLVGSETTVSYICDYLTCCILGKVLKCVF